MTPRREIEGISGWSQIAPLMESIPDEMVKVTQRCESPIEQLFSCAIALVLLTIENERRPSLDTQVPIGRYRADIVLTGPNGAPRIVVECDGAAFHNDVAKDAKRTAEIERHGYRVIRVTGQDIHHNPIARAMILLREVGMLTQSLKRAHI